MRFLGYAYFCFCATSGIDSWDMHVPLGGRFHGLCSPPLSRDGVHVHMRGGAPSEERCVQLGKKVLLERTAGPDAPQFYGNCCFSLGTGRFSRNPVLQPSCCATAGIGFLGYAYFFACTTRKSPKRISISDSWDMHAFFFVQLISEYPHIRRRGVVICAQVTSDLCTDH